MQETDLMNEIRALREERDRLRTIVAYTHDMEYWQDDDGRLIYISPSCERTTGYTVDDFLQDPTLIATIVHPEDRAIFERHERECMEKKDVSLVTFRIVCRDGTIKWMEHISQPVFMADGQSNARRISDRDVTARKQAEADLDRERLMLRSVIDTMPDFVYVKDAQARYVVNNAAHLRSLNAGSQQEVTGKTVFDFHPAEQAKLYYKDELQVLHTGEPILNREEQVWDPVSGEQIWNLTTKAPMQDSQGKIVGLVGVSRNITQRKKAEERVRQSEERLRHLIDNADDMIFQTDPVGNLEFINPTAAKVLKYKESELLGRKFQELIPADARPSAVAFYSNQVNEKIPNTYYELPFLAGDGTEVWIGQNVQLTIESGRVVSLQAIARDITQRRKVEMQLAQEKLFFESLVDISPVAIVWLDLEERITSCNPAFEKLFGYRREEVIGFPLDPLISTDATLSEAHNYTKMALSGTLAHGHSQRCKKDGSILEVEIFGVPLNIESRCVGVLALYHDITELVEARHQAEAADRAKSAFLASMSHEIRTPLNGVIGMTGLLLETNLSSQQKQFAETVRISGENLAKIIDDILDFSKIEADKLDLESIDFDLQELIESIGTLFAERAYKKGLELITYLDPNVPTSLVGDPLRIGQVLTNLVGNALKFTEFGEISVRVKMEEASEKLVVLHIIIQDTGIGISPEQQEILFQPFTQADTSTTRRFGGTGLGLAISHRLMQMMNGKISLESEIDKGSCFHLRLPLKKGIPEAGKVFPAVTSLAGLRVLIVDDNETNRTVLHHQVLAWNMIPTCVSNAAEALKKLQDAASREDSFHIALLDMEMPGMDGIGLAREIRTIPRIASIHLILLSSIGKIGNEKSIRELGFDAEMVKPVRQSDLYRCLLNVLGVAPPEYAKISSKETLRQHLGEGNTVRVLVVEDNPVNQRVAILMLESRGYQADLADNGQEAIKAIEKTVYDAVLMDCQMPVMDGFTATAEIRRREGPHRHTPIIALTAHALKEERSHCLSSGMDDYISKPIKPEVLFSTLRRWAPVASPPSKESSTSTIADYTGAHPPATASASESLIDHTVLYNLQKLRQPGGPNIVKEFIDLFFVDLVPKMTELQNCIKEHDAKRLGKLAHTLKGSSGSIGAVAMSRTFADLEASGKNSDWSNVPHLQARLDREIELTRTALEAEKAD